MEADRQQSRVSMTSIDMPISVNSTFQPPNTSTNAIPPNLSMIVQNIMNNNLQASSVNITNNQVSTVLNTVINPPIIARDEVFCTRVNDAMMRSFAFVDIIDLAAAGLLPPEALKTNKKSKKKQNFQNLVRPVNVAGTLSL